MNWRRWLGGAAVALPSLLWVGDKVWGALEETDKIPLLEMRLLEHDRADERLAAEVKELRAYTMEMLMLQHREFGDERRAGQISEELRKLKEVNR